MRDWPPHPLPIFPISVFLDRDGTINTDTYYPHKSDELEFVPGSLEALVILARLPIHIIVVSNQSGIAKGMYERADMSSFNRELRLRAKDAGGRIDAFYYCPHFEIADLNPGQTASDCSKPSPGMLLEASGEYGIDLTSSIMVGDKSTDIVAGRRAGCTTVLVKSGYGGMEEGAVPVKPDYVEPDLFSAVDIIASIFEERTAVADETLIRPGL